MPLVVDDGSATSALDHHSHFDHLPDSDHLHDSSPLELSDGGSGPRTPPALLTAAQLPADPKQAIWPYPSAPNQHLLKKKSNKNQPHMHTPTPPAGAAPTISTFSASNLNHIHIVQPYVHTGVQNSSSTSTGKTSAPSNACTTSTFSVHQPPASSTSQFSVANPYCTNELHSYLPSPGSAATTTSGQPPRPANAWILYRSDKMKNIAPAPGQPRPPQADISKLIAAMWKNETPEIRQHYEELSDVKKAQHLALYPGYRFQPMKKADREKMRAEKKAEKEREKLSQLSLKTYRKPKPKRGMTEDSDIMSPTTTGNMPWQSADAAPISPLSARGHAFSYQPYAIPSPTTPTTPGAAPVKRKRAKTKVEAQTPAIPAEEPRAEYVPDASHYYESQPDYTSYTPQLSSSSSDPNLHQQHLYTPPDGQPHIQGDQSNSYQTGTANAVPIIPESMGVFDIANLDLANLGQDIQISLPQDFDWSGAGGLGGFEGLVMEGGLGDLAGFSGGFAEFSDLVNLDAMAGHASSMDTSQLGPGLLDGVDMGMGDYKQGMVDPSSLNYPTSTGSMQYADSTFTMTSSTSSTTAGVTPSHVHGGHAPHLSISTQSLQSAVTSPVVETPHSATSQFGSFAIHPQTYSHQHQLHHHHSHSGQQFMSPQSFQSLVSPTQSHFASPPPGSVVDESEGYAPSNAALAGHVTRKTVTTWR